LPIKKTGLLRPQIHIELVQKYQLVTVRQVRAHRFAAVADRSPHLRRPAVEPLQNDQLPTYDGPRVFHLESLVPRRNQIDQAAFRAVQPDGEALVAYPLTADDVVSGHIELSCHVGRSTRSRVGAELMNRVG